MPQVGFESTIAVGKQPYAYALSSPYTYESGPRARLGELDSGARLGYIYIYI
jgi:hypothetical protein